MLTIGLLTITGRGRGAIKKECIYSHCRPQNSQCSSAIMADKIKDFIIDLQEQQQDDTQPPQWSSVSISPTTPEEKKPIIIFVEGIIGAGKSTLLDKIERTAFPYYDAHVILENVPLWECVDGYNCLELFYKDSAKYSFLFQSLVMLSQYEALIKTLNRIEKQECLRPQVVICERSLYTSAFVFQEILTTNGFLNEAEYAVLKYVFSYYWGSLKGYKSAFIYLDTPEDLALTRVQKRAREGETQIDLKYLNALARQHRVLANVDPHWHIVDYPKSQNMDWVMSLIGHLIMYENEKLKTL
ncbi:putative deoxynucleoside kinase dNK [Cotesia congregata filamentous virus 1]|uniref:Deoxynucleoside kinase dNK n=1 Tax=Cotesia congregata filamentous virus 1 TaxID=3064291 RepID=A0ABC8QJL8_9VIRU|nr:putative deoxynucleoside kinase dNK [Cotesia congregata filamentous virus 1]